MGVVERIHRERLANQMLAGAQGASALDVVRRLVAVRCADWRAARLIIAHRTAGPLPESGIESELRSGRFAVTHAFGPTPRLVCVPDLGWVRGLLGPPRLAASERALAKSGLSPGRLAASEGIVTETLADGGVWTGRRLADRLRQCGLDLPAAVLRAQLTRLELDGAIDCLPPDGGQIGYRLGAQTWHPGPEDERPRLKVVAGGRSRGSRRAGAGRRSERDTSLARLVIRYLAGHGPATVDDIAYWSALSADDIHRGLHLASEVIERRGAGRHVFYSLSGPSVEAMGGPLRFLPRQDEILQGYRESRHLLDGGGHAPSGGRGVGPKAPGAMANPVLWAGHLAGWWTSAKRGRDLEYTWSVYNRGLVEASVIEAVIAWIATYHREPVTLRTPSRVGAAEQ